MVEPEIWICLVSIWNVLNSSLGSTQTDSLASSQSACRCFSTWWIAALAEPLSVVSTVRHSQFVQSFAQLVILVPCKKPLECLLRFYPDMRDARDLEDWIHDYIWNVWAARNRFSDGFPNPTPSSSELCQSFRYFLHFVHLCVLALDATNYEDTPDASRMTPLQTQPHCDDRACNLHSIEAYWSMSKHVEVGLVADL